MMHRLSSRHRTSPVAHTRQRGVVMVMVTVGMVALLAMAGLALDSGHMFLTKTRLQNAVDAAALSAARSLKSTDSMATATAVARTTFGDNLSAPGNDELAEAWAGGAGEIQLDVQYSPTLNPFSSSATPPYVRVRATGLTLDSWLIQVIGVTEKSVGATAVAGPVSVTGICDLVPMLACGCDPADSDCCDGTDESCGSDKYFGYNIPEADDELKLEGVTAVKISGGDEQDIGPGNFHLLRLGGDQGGNYIRDALAGVPNNLCAEVDPVTGEEIVYSEPGNKVGPAVSGINARFDGGSYGSGQSKVDMAPDYIKKEALDDTGDKLILADDGSIQTQNGAEDPELYGYKEYLDDTKKCPNGGEYGVDCSAGGETYRRMMLLPIGHCSGMTNGTSSPIPVQGYGCFLLLQKGEQGNAGADLFGQFVGGESAKGCDAAGGISPGQSPSLPTQIVLFRDPDSGDS